jgi:hypothetical protein
VQLSVFEHLTRKKDGPSVHYRSKQGGYMTSRKMTGVVVILACMATITSGCGGTPTEPTDENGGGVTLPRPAPPTASSAILRVTVDSNCSGRDSNIQVYIDGSYVGLAQPGDSGVSKTVSIGDHTVSATGQGGTQWSPSTRSVPAAGYSLNLTCNTTVPPPQPTTATLRVQVDANCTGKAANVEVSIDGLSAGTTQPGSTGISKVVSVGNHTIFGRASNGTTWPTFTVAVSSGGHNQNLTCQ